MTISTVLIQSSCGFDTIHVFQLLWAIYHRYIALVKKLADNGKFLILDAWDSNRVI
jgi:hypothetical protein